MTAKRVRFVSDDELRRALDTAKEYGIDIGMIDIRADGVAIHPANCTPGTEFDRWLSQDKNRDPAAHRR